MEQLELDLGIKPLSDRSPIRYVGGKSKSWEIFEPYLPKDITLLVSPFLGGGGIEVKCAARGIKVIASDRFEPLVNFWQSFIKDPRKVIDLAIQMVPLSYEERSYYYEIELKPQCKNYEGIIYDNIERAVIFLLVNRMSFRAYTLKTKPSKNYIEEDSRPSLLKKFRSWYNPNISVNHMDYRQVFHHYNGNFMYLDPPYVNNEHIYGSKGTDKTFDHHEFQRRVSKLNNRWIMSYNKHDLILDLYKDYRIVEYKKYYSNGSKNTVGTELFIMNY